LELVDPIEPWLQGTASLVIVPHRFLFGVPFSALRDGEAGRYLVERMAVTIAPSAGVYVATKHRDSPNSVSNPRVLAVGDPTFDRSIDPGLPSLPGSSVEADAVFQVYSGGSQLLLGDDATRDRLVSLASQFEVLHLATHGLVDLRRPMNSRLALAATGERGNSALRAGDILALDLRGTSVVVLAACDSAAGVASASEGPLNLARPFLAAGVPAVVASLWQVNDERSQQLLIRFHQGLNEGLAVQDAMRRAKVEVLRELPRPSVAVWGTFEVYGSGAVHLVHSKGR
jgi:CHAT domain-containing protein